MVGNNAAILSMTHSETIRFINLYKNEPVLWDSKLPGYRDREARSAALLRIVAAMQIANFGAEHAVMKFKNLRSSYCQELKKISRNEALGELYVPKVVWFNTMNSFLRPHVIERSLSLKTTRAISPSTSSDSEFHIDRISMKRKVDNPILHIINMYSNDSESRRKIARATQQNVIIKTSDEDFNCKVEVASDEESQNIALPVLEEPAQSSPSFEPANEEVPKKDDSFDCFGKYVASLLREMRKDKAFGLQRRIMDFILNTQLGSED